MSLTFQYDLILRLEFNTFMCDIIMPRHTLITGSWTLSRGCGRDRFLDANGFSAINHHNACEKRVIPRDLLSVESMY